MEKSEKANILIVDDSPNKQNIIEMILAPLNENLVKLDSGRETLKYLLLHEVALIILDVQMPGMDGFETAALVRKRKKNEFTPIIFVTAYSTADTEITRGYEMGAVDYMFTPVIPQILKSKVKVLLDLFKMNRTLINQNRELENAYTSIQSLNLNLKQKTHQLERANRELESFSYSVSHDLRAPLRHIEGFSGLLKLNLEKNKLDDKSIRFLDNILASIVRMNHLIEDLLAFSRMAREDMIHQKVDMNKIIDTAIKELTGGLKDIEIEWKCALLPEVLADTSMIKQVWQNLISNAIKYSSTRKKIVIEIGCIKKEKEFEFFIKDNGVGFDPKLSHRLFTVFQRLHTEAEFEGTGIGLALVRKIIERHGGETSATAEIDNGATFCFTLPVP